MEQVWFALPVIMLLSQLGGWRNKLYRRIGIPITITITAIIAHGWTLWLIPNGIMIWCATILPFTLIGDNIDDNWFNYVWIVIWSLLLTISGILLSIPYQCVPLYLKSLLVAFPCIYGCAMLSNLKLSAKYFPWKFCEAICWGMAMYPSLIILST